MNSTGYCIILDVCTGGVYYMVLDVGTVLYYCIVLDVGIVLCWKIDCERVKRKCNGFAARRIPSSFWTEIKGLENLFVDVAHRLGEPHYICVSL